jgi:diguanylate cyclase (GGDEF)-like protein
MKTLIESTQQINSSAALALSTHFCVQKALLDTNLSKTRLRKLRNIISKLRGSEAYEDIEVTFINRDGVSIGYRKDENLTYFQKDIQQLQKDPQPIHTIKNTQAGMTFNSIVPIVDTYGDFMGAIVVTKPFDCVTKELKSISTTALVLFDKESKRHLTQAIHRHSMDEYDMVNLSADKAKIKMINEKKLEYFLTNKGYRYYKKHLIVPFQLKDIYSNQRGYYLLIKPMEAFAYQNISRLLYRLDIVLFALLFLAFLFMFKFYQNKNEIKMKSRYFKEVVNSTMDIIIVTTEHDIVDVNQAFFHFFDAYDSLDAFSQEHGSIANLFIEDEGFIQKNMGLYSWVEYMHYHKRSEHQVKIQYNDTVHIFAVKIQAISHAKVTIDNEPLYTVVLSDITKIKEYQKELEALSKTDILTKIGNRALFEQHIAMELSRASRYGSKLSLMMFDIESLKKINKLYGHEAGDRALRAVAKSVNTSLRAADLFCRYQGGSFIIVLPHTSKEGTVTLAKRLYEQIQTLEIEFIGHVDIKIGITEFREDDWCDGMVQRVQRALQQSKKSNERCMSVI